MDDRRPLMSLRAQYICVLLVISLRNASSDSLYASFHSSSDLLQMNLNGSAMNLEVLDTREQSCAAGRSSSYYSQLRGIATDESNRL